MTTLRKRLYELLKEKKSRKKRLDKPKDEKLVAMTGTEIDQVMSDRTSASRITLISKRNDDDKEWGRW